MSWDIESFREKVESQHVFPGKYTFKFIVAQAQKQEILDILPEADISFRESGGNKYVSITAVSHLESSQDVLDVYFAANKVEGCIAL